MVKGCPVRLWVIYHWQNRNVVFGSPRRDPLFLTLARLAPGPDWEIRCFRHLPDWLHFPTGALSVLSREPDCKGIPIDVFSRLARIPDLLLRVICQIALSSRLDSRSRLALIPDCTSVTRLPHNPDWLYIGRVYLEKWRGGVPDCQIGCDARLSLIPDWF